MSSDVPLDLLREALTTTLVIAAPVLLVLFASSLLVSLIQSVMNLHDPTVAAVPRLAIGAVTILCLLPWIIDRLSDFSVGVYRFGG